MCLIYDGHSGHIQLEVVSLLRENRVHVVAFPSHTSHVLQPLDVSVFGPFKSRVQAQLHKLSRHTRCIDVFGASMCLTTAYNASVTYINILHGFKRTGLWVRNADGPSAERLTRLFTEHGRKVTVAEVMRFFDKSTRGLLFSADVVENGTMRINTSTGAVLTCDQFLGAHTLRA